MEVVDLDSLSKIFHYLDVIERIKLELVCHRWRSLLMRQSSFSDMRKLNVADFLTTTSRNYFQQESLSFEPTVLGIVERCGAYVFELSFGERWLRVSQTIINGIADCCHRLRVINLGSVILNADLSPILERVGSQLEFLSFEETSWVDQENAVKVTKFFPYLHRLRYFNVRSATQSILEQMHHISGKLRVLEMSCVHTVSPEVMNTLLEYQDELEELYISPTPLLNDDVVQRLASLRHLRKLSIGYVDRKDVQMEMLGMLNKLRELRISSVQCLTEMSLRMILANMPHLEVLSIDNCKNVFDYTSLEHCRSLTKLEISRTLQLSNDDLHAISSYGNLKKLRLHKCFNISTPIVNYVLQKNQLKELDVSECSHLTDEVPFNIVRTQENLEYISVQGCSGITSKGVAALCHMRNVELLRELDVSKNRQIDDMAILSLHNVLTLRRQQKEQSCSQSGREEERDADRDAEEQESEKRVVDTTKLTIYILETSVSRGVDKKVGDCIQLLY